MGTAHCTALGTVQLAPQERQYRIEVGYGLEPVITDARAGDIGRGMVPLLRQGNYSGAVQQAVGALAQLIAGERGVTLSSAPPASPREPGSDTGLGRIGIWPVLLLVLVMIGVLRVLATAARGNRLPDLGSVVIGEDRIGFRREAGNRRRRSRCSLVLREAPRPSSQRRGESEAT